MWLKQSGPLKPYGRFRFFRTFASLICAPIYPSPGFFLGIDRHDDRLEVAKEEGKAREQRRPDASGSLQEGYGAACLIACPDHAWSRWAGATVNSHSKVNQLQ